MSKATPVADSTPVDETQAQTDTESGQDALVIWERIRQRVDDRLSVVETHAHRLLDRNLTEPELVTAGSTADALAVELGQLGIPSAAGLARHMAALLENDPTAITAVQLASTIEDIRTLVSSAIAQQSSSVSPHGRVVLLGPDSPERDAIAWMVGSRGYDICVGEKHISGEPPAAVLLAAPWGHDSATASLLEAVAESWRVPVLALHSVTKPEALRQLAGWCTTTLELSSHPDLVAGELAKAIAASGHKPHAVVCGSPGETMDLLRDHSFEVTEVPDADHLLDSITNPDSLVVFGTDVEPTLAIESAQLIRATPHTRRVVMLWEVTDAPPLLALQAHRAGVRTISAMSDEVLSQVRATLTILALDLTGEDQDASRLVSWPAAQVLIDRALVASLRSGAMIAMASIRIGATISDERVERAITILGSEFRRGDIVGLRDDRNIVVTLQGVSQRVATNRMTELFERLNLDDPGSHIGISVFPTDGRSALELAAAADGAVAMSHLHSGPSVVSSNWRPASELSPDVLVVDPDSVLSAMLTAALTERGYRPESIGDGKAAYARLTGSGQHAPKLLLLDLDTPGLDGLTLLRRLRTARALSQMRVLLMTARSAESDLRAALELGVADVIRKPFYTTLLLHRISRLLEDSR